MKLTDKQISKISDLVIKNFKQKKLADFKTQEIKIKEAISNTILMNQKQELELDKEVEQFLDQFKEKFENGELEYRKMFSLTKKELAKKKGFVL